MHSMLRLEEADHAFACRGEEGWKEISHAVISTRYLIVCTKNPKKYHSEHTPAHIVILRNEL